MSCVFVRIKQDGGTFRGSVLWGNGEGTGVLGMTVSPCPLDCVSSINDTHTVCVACRPISCLREEMKQT